MDGTSQTDPEAEARKPWPFAAEMAERHRGYVLDHFHIKADGKLLKGTITNVAPPKRIGTGLEGPDRAHFTYTISYPLPKPPAIFEFSQDMCREFPSSPGVPWDLSYATRYGPPENPVMSGGGGLLHPDHVAEPPHAALTASSGLSRSSRSVRRMSNPDLGQLAGGGLRLPPAPCRRTWRR